MPFGISFSVHLREIHFLFLSENVFISCNLGEDTFTEHRTLSRHSYLWHFKVLFSDFRCEVRYQFYCCSFEIIDFFFSLTDLTFFSLLFLAFSSITIMHLRVVFFVFSCLRFMAFIKSVVWRFSQFWKVLNHTTSNIASAPFFFSSPSLLCLHINRLTFSFSSFSPMWLFCFMEAGNFILRSGLCYRKLF